MKYSKIYGKSYQDYLAENGEVGSVISIKHPVIRAEGVPSLKPEELVFFETGELGYTIGLHEDFAEIVVLSKLPAQSNTTLTRTNRLLEVPLSTNMLGYTLNPLGKSLDPDKPSPIPHEYRSVFSSIPSIMKRRQIDEPFITGVSAVDLLVPLGRGQRELVIGDRKTGKTQFLLQNLKTQAAQENTICIYSAIGKQRDEILQVRQYLQTHNLTDKTLLLVTLADDPIGLIHLAPYAAMTVAEFFRDQGHDVLLILDDLSTHARYYRELSLLANRFPGRSSYPGDIFYAHATLLERAGCFGDEYKNTSITCLPVAETVDGDKAGYIPTNLMSITDGHLFFDADMYISGRRPAINPFLSVTRVGRQTQSPVRWGVNRELNTFLSWVEKTRSFSHFGAELNAGIESILNMGNSIDAFFNQHPDVVLPIHLQVFLFCLIWIGTWQNENIAKMNTDIHSIINAYTTNEQFRQNIDQTITTANDFNQLLGVLSQQSSKLLEGVL